MNEDILAHLRCPDDAGELRSVTTGLRCADCGREFPEIAPGVFDLLPLRPNPRAVECLCSAHREYYLKEFERSICLGDRSLPWGAPEATPDKWAAQKRRQVDWLLPLVLPEQSGKDLILCDVSAGSGYYTLRLAEHFKYVLHCDLSAQSISYGKRSAEQAGLNNMLFFRVDYLSLPFRSIDRLICMDTLIRGQQHEEMLMRALSDSLSTSGTAVVDFHNWWHNPARRMGLLPQNFHHNRSYSKREARDIVGRSGLRHCEYFRYDEGSGNSAALPDILRGFLPPSRLTFRVSS